MLRPKTSRSYTTCYLGSADVGFPLNTARISAISAANARIARSPWNVAHRSRYFVQSDDNLPDLQWLICSFICRTNNAHTTIIPAMETAAANVKRNADG